MIARNYSVVNTSKHHIADIRSLPALHRRISNLEYQRYSTIILSVAERPKVSL